MKYKFTGETKEFCGITFHQIVCVTAFASIASGEVGGWIEKENCLSQSGDAWVSGNAWVSGDARVFGDARVLLGLHKTKDACLLQIQGSKHSVNSPDFKMVKIGCQEHDPQFWLDNFESIGIENDYSQEQIVEYKRYIDLFAQVIAEHNSK